MRPTSIATPWILPGLLLIVFSSGCALLPQRPAGSSRDHAFITYFPPPENSKKLRLAIKDNIDMRGVVTTAGSEYLSKNRPPAARDAACLAIARQRGVHIVGKVNLSEFAVAPSGINDYYGTPKNPYSRWQKLIPGGSSCGSAYVVAHGKADIAFGTDTAGSVRVPSAFCGVVGLKTTFGLVPLDGLQPVEPKYLDTVGPIARDVAGAARGMDLLQNGFAARYAAAVASTPAAQSIKIGRLILRGTDNQIDRAVDEALTRAGFQVIPLGDAFRAKWEQAQQDGNTLAASGAWISNQQYAGKPGVTARTRSILAVGAIAYNTQYRAAVARRAAWQRNLRAVFDKVDFIALPTVQTLPPRIPPSLKVLLEANLVNQQNTVAVNFAGNPALAIPIPVQEERIPVTSLQLIGPPRSEAQLLATGRLLETKY
jgi:amidase